MFESYKFIDCSRNKKTNIYIYTYEIIDSSFINKIDIATEVTSQVGEAECAAVIKIYESKKLNVVKNLFLLNLYICKDYNYKMNDLLYYQKQFMNKYYNVNYDKYYDDLVKYTDRMIILC